MKCLNQVREKQCERDVEKLPKCLMDFYSQFLMLVFLQVEGFSYTRKRSIKCELFSTKKKWFHWRILKCFRFNTFDSWRVLSKHNQSEWKAAITTKPHKSITDAEWMLYCALPTFQHNATDFPRQHEEKHFRSTIHKATCRHKTLLKKSILTWRCVINAAALAAFVQIDYILSHTIH